MKIRYRNQNLTHYFYREINTFNTMKYRQFGVNIFYGFITNIFYKAKSCDNVDNDN